MAEAPEEVFSAPDLTTGERLLLALLWRHAGAANGNFVWPSKARLATLLQVDSSTIRRRLHRLRTSGWLVSERRTIGGFVVEGWVLSAERAGLPAERAGLPAERAGLHVPTL